jgi:hypothetical protein
MIDLDDLQHRIGLRRDALVEHYEEKAANDLARMEKEGAEEEAGGGTSQAEYVRRYHENHADDIALTNLMADFGLALIAIAERLEK